MDILTLHVKCLKNYKGHRILFELNVCEHLIALYLEKYIKGMGSFQSYEKMESVGTDNEEEWLDIQLEKLTNQLTIEEVRPLLQQLDEIEPYVNILEAKRRLFKILKNTPLQNFRNADRTTTLYVNLRLQMRDTTMRK